MNNGVTVDASQVLRMFSELNSRQQKNVYKNALRKAGRILQKETKTQLRSVPLAIGILAAAEQNCWQ